MGTDVLIDMPKALTVDASSWPSDSTARRRERPVKTMRVLSEKPLVAATSFLASSAIRRSGVAVDSVRNVVRDRAAARLGGGEVVYRSQRMLSAVFELRRVIVPWA